MNTRELRKQQRIELLIKKIRDEKITDYGSLVNLLIVNFAVSKKTALEEVNAVRGFLEK